MNGRWIGKTGAFVLALWGMAAGLGSTATRADARPLAPLAQDDRDEALARLSTKLGEMGKSINDDLDVDSNAKKAQKRWKLAGDEYDRALKLLAEFRDVHRNGRNDREAAAECDRLAEEARRSLGSEAGGEFGDWLREKEDHIQRLGADMGRLGAQLSDEANRKAQDALAKSLDAGKLAEQVQKQASDSVNKAMKELKLKLQKNNGSLVDKEQIERSVREALEQAKEAQAQASDQVRQALKNVPSSAEIQKQVETALEAARKGLESYKGVEKETLRRALEQSARSMRDQADTENRRQKSGSREKAQAQEEKARQETIAAYKRAKAMEGGARERLSSTRQSEDQELERSRKEIEDLRARLKELEAQVESMRRERKTRDV